MGALITLLENIGLLVGLLRQRNACLADTKHWQEQPGQKSSHQDRISTGP